jgi:hypothetical protein
MSTPTEGISGRKNNNSGDKAAMVAAAEAAYEAGSDADKREAYAEALEHMETAHRLYKEALGERDRKTLAAAGWIGSALANVGRLKEALKHNQAHLDVCRAVLGEMDELTTIAMDGVIETLKRMGRYPDVC